MALLFPSAAEKIYAVVGATAVCVVCYVIPVYIQLVMYRRQREAAMMGGRCEVGSRQGGEGHGRGVPGRLGGGGHGRGVPGRFSAGWGGVQRAMAGGRGGEFWQGGVGGGGATSHGRGMPRRLCKEEEWAQSGHVGSVNYVFRWTYNIAACCHSCIPIVSMPLLVGCDTLACCVALVARCQCMNV